MNTKFDQFISEMVGSEGSSETDIIRSIRQDLTKCSSNLENLQAHANKSYNHKVSQAVDKAL